MTEKTRLLRLMVGQLCVLLTMLPIILLTVSAIRATFEVPPDQRWQPIIGSLVFGGLWLLMRKTEARIGRHIAALEGDPVERMQRRVDKASTALKRASELYRSLQEEIARQTESLKKVSAENKILEEIREVNAKQVEEVEAAVRYVEHKRGPRRYGRDAFFMFVGAVLLHPVGVAFTEWVRGH